MNYSSFYGHSHCLVSKPVWRPGSNVERGPLGPASSAESYGGEVTLPPYCRGCRLFWFFRPGSSNYCVWLLRFACTGMCEYLVEAVVNMCTGCWNYEDAAIPDLTDWPFQIRLKKYW